jgi:Holliday junction resolvasome RuvABC endonuclease subunit
MHHFFKGNAQMPKNKGRKNQDVAYVPRKQREARTSPQPEVQAPIKTSGVPYTLALDPSSTAIGWACFAGDVLWRCGVWRPQGTSPLEARCDQIADAVLQMVSEVQPDRVLIEVSSRMAYNPRRAKSLPALLYAQGGTVQAVRSTGTPATTINEQEWTGRKPKHQRAKLIALTEPVYHAFAHRDKGLDAADAVGLGRWWLTTNALRHAIGA